MNPLQRENRVRLLDGPFKVRQDIHLRYLLAVEPDRLLAPFREQAGLPPRAERYGGWESRDIGGHSLGHYLSALAYMHEGTGDERLLACIRQIVEDLGLCQAANGGAYVLPVKRDAFEKLRLGEIEVSPFALNGVWVPFYTLHKLLAGLRDAWRLCGCVQALEIEAHLCDWLEDVLRILSAAQIQEVLQCEHGGMNEVLADLTADTGDERYLRMAAQYFHHHQVLDPMLRGEDRLDGLHGNTQIPKVIGLAREYELSGDTRYRLAASSFWETVVNQRSYAIGGHGESEHFFPVEQFPQRLTPNTCETCNTYNMLKLTRHVFSWEPSAAHMDFVERAMINHLAANIGREPGEFGYFLGLGSVGVKVFSTPFDSWWCCVGTGMENPARYGELIYHRNANVLWVNLYFGSVFADAEEGVEIRQETTFPDEDTTRFSFVCEKPWHQEIWFRHPSWCAKPEVTLNGVLLETRSDPSSYFSLNLTWQTGDTLEIRLPMTLRLESLPHSDGSLVAVLFGPNVLAAIVPNEPGSESPAKERFSEHLDARGKTDACPPVFVADDPGSILAALAPAGEFAAFRSRGLVAPGDLVFVPFHRIYEEQYAVYFPVFSPENWKIQEATIRAERERQRDREACTVDSVTPGYQQPEIEHKLAYADSSVSDFQGRKCRESGTDGWFSYVLKVAPNVPMTLVATYWGGEWVRRTFDIEVDGVRIATQTLRTNQPGDFFDVSYALPEERIAGKSHVTVRFAAHPGSAVGRVFVLKMMRGSDEELLLA
ncbi:MAG TPA: glycoside hydrolase family 127 protein [Terrimicrobiaceae bacterium]|nr:glycoside hydrolase family 127 protein [Terrimicrobiaceae bacterium]